MNRTKQLFVKSATPAVQTRPLAFTLLDLLAIVAMLFLLGSMLASGLARTRPTGQSVQCMTNVRRQANAWQMYAQDNNDKLVIAYQGGNAQSGNDDPRFGPGWAAGWLDWTTSTDNTNVSFLVGRYASFSAYLSDPSVFQCPADTFVSSVQRSRGWTRRARSYSMDIALGEGNAESGPWNTFYAHVKKMSEMRFPSPAQTWVFVEEHPDSINDPAFMLPNQASWLTTLPGSITATRHCRSRTVMLSHIHGRGLLHPTAEQ